MTYMTNDISKTKLHTSYINQYFSLSKQYVVLLNDLTCSCPPPSGLALQVSDIEWTKCKQKHMLLLQTAHAWVRRKIISRKVHDVRST